MRAPALYMLSRCFDITWHAKKLLTRNRIIRPLSLDYYVFLDHVLLVTPCSGTLPTPVETPSPTSSLRLSS